MAINRANGGLIGKKNVTSSGGNVISTFSASGTHVLQSGTTEIDLLVVAGGGSGGASTSGAIMAGGGGAGGFQNLTGQSVVSGDTIAVTVGAGGGASPAPASSDVQGNDGSDSVYANPISPITSIGGGGGGGGEDNAKDDGRDGGSGGGAAYAYNSGSVKGDGTAGQGNDGGASSLTVGGGGGGAGAVGEAGGTGTNLVAGGDGGIGSPSTITGTNVMYAGGGGGASYGKGTGTPDPQGGAGGQMYHGQGGFGGGGFGNHAAHPSAHASGGAAGAGVANVGGGGGGSSGVAPGNVAVDGTGAAGGSGIVVVKEKDKANGVFNMNSQFISNKKGQWPDNRLFDVTGSTRYNNEDSPKLTYAVTNPSAQVFTISMWAKLGDLAGNMGLWSIGKALTGETGDYSTAEAGFSSAGRLALTAYDGVANVNRFNYNTAATGPLYNDPTAWYHFVWAFDMRNATVGLRTQFYVNGIDHTTRLTTSTAPAELVNLFDPSGSSIAIGYRLGQNSYMDGYIAEVHYIDGQQLHCGHFGEPDSDNPTIWRPKQYHGTYGANGLRLEFKQTGTSANASGIGADTSGNDNHMAVTNLAAIDVVEDVPSNNFCTLNPLDVYASSGGTLSEGNTKLVVTTSGLHTAAGTFAPTNGKWYWEVELDATDGSNPSNVGISDLSRDTKANMPSKLAWGYGYNASTGDKQNSANNSSYGDSYGAGDIVSVAMDLDNGAVYFAKAGTFQASGDPTSGASKTNAAFTWTPTADMNWCPYVADNTSGVSFTWLTNFGNPPFAISSGNADANGFGNFEYAPPAGYLALCTKNLASTG
jgi:hypothetical protein